MVEIWGQGGEGQGLVGSRGCRDLGYRLGVKGMGW